MNIPVRLDTHCRGIYVRAGRPQVLIHTARIRQPITTAMQMYYNAAHGQPMAKLMLTVHKCVKSVQIINNHFNKKSPERGILCLSNQYRIIYSE